MIIIYVTDARPQYPPSILVTAAMPVGAKNQYRYAIKWLTPSLLDDWKANLLNNTDVLICYLEGNSGTLDNARAFPVRFGKVNRTDIHGSYATIEVILGDFCSIRSLYELTHLSGSDNIVSPGPREKKFVVDISVQRRPGNNHDTITTWQAITEELAGTAAFANASFTFFEGAFQEASSEQALRPKEGVLELAPNSSYEFVFHVLAPSLEARTHSYTLHVEDSIIHMVDSNDLRLKYKFTTFRLLVRTVHTLRPEDTTLKLSLETVGVGSEFSLRLRVTPTGLSQVRALAFPSISAATAASAGVLPSHTPIWIRISMVTAGSIGLAVSSRRKP